MSRKCPQHTKQFKLDAVNYRKEHPDLTQTEVAKNLGIGISTLARWEAQDALDVLKKPSAFWEKINGSYLHRSFRKGRGV